MLGVVREQVLAGLFGASDAMDAYNVAYRVPNLLRDLFAEGAMSAAFVPTFARELVSGGKASALKLGTNVVSALVVVTGVAVVLGLVFAEPLAGLLAPGYAEVPGKLALVALMTRIMVPFLMFIALAAAFMGMLNALGHFFIPALSPATFNVVNILCAFLLVPVMPALGLPPIAAIAIGTLVGGVAQWAVQWPALRREGFRYRPHLDWSDPGLRRVLLLMGPGTLGLAATQVNLFVNTVLAAREGTGAVSFLSYAFRLMYLPIGLFGVSVATVTTPTVARLAAQADQAAVRKTIADGLLLMLSLNVPATVGLAVLATPIVQLMYERGAFTHAETVATAAVLQFYAVGLVGYSVVRIASPAFYAIGRSQVPVVVSALTVVVNALLNVFLADVLSYRGLALGTSLAALVNAGLLLVLLRRHLGGLDGARIGTAAVKIAVAALVMGGAALAIDRAVTGWVASTSLSAQLLRVGTSIGGALAVLAGVAYALRITALTEALDLVRRRVRGRTSV